MTMSKDEPTTSPRRVGPKPSWLKTELPGPGRYAELRRLLADLELNTVCTEAACPNMGECWKRGCATIMILGSVCTRSCRFCNVDNTESPRRVDPKEPRNVAKALATLDLNHTVVTSVTRDDLPDGGARHWAETIAAIHEECPQLTLEALVPDFQGSTDSLDLVLQTGPEVLSHNLETVSRLAPTIRPQASYELSIEMLRHASNRSALTKSGLMLGLGETDDEVVEALGDLLDAGVRIVTLGQYLQPTRRHAPVERFVPPEKFEDLRKEALEMGFECVESAPLVRSSYRADRQAHLCRPSR
jgi:lipoic acid synthetase